MTTFLWIADHDFLVLALFILVAWTFPYHRMPKRWRDVPRWEKWR